MNCWAILELDDNASLKDIKKSYAKKLKSNKPDENPEGFQRLNAAYQEACQIAKYQARQHAYEQEQAEQEQIVQQESLQEPQIQPLEEDLKDTSLAVPLIERELSAQQDPATLPQQEQAEASYSEDDLAHDVEVLMQSDSLNDLSKWETLLSSPLLYEIRFRGWFTLRLFYLVSYKLEAEKQQAKEAENKDIQQTEPVLEQATLDFLNEKIMWTHQLDRLESHFDHDEMERVTQRLIPNQPTANAHDINAIKQDGKEVKDHASIFKRLAAFIIDSMIYVLGMHFIEKCNALLPDDVVLSENQLIGVYLIWLCVLLPFMESTRLQASPGKWLVGIKVVSKKGKKLNSFHSLIRFALCIANILGLKITVLVNAFMYDGRLLHDRVSFSKVVNRSNDS